MNDAQLLIANRGEIAIRIARAAAGLGIRTIAVYSTDDARSLHVKSADEAVALEQAGAPAYLDARAIVGIARDRGCGLVHPGYGFLSENADFAQLCLDSGIKFVGPPPKLLNLFGDKTKGLQLAHSNDVPTIRSTHEPGREAIEAFFDSLPPGSAILIKAAAGGGGRGMRVVRRREDIPDAITLCSREAELAFGNGTVYAEEYWSRARHIEVQIVGDGNAAIHLGERDCTLQRRHQKLVEIAPSPFISTDTRDAIASAALKMARSVRYESLGTFEFLVADRGHTTDFAFIEANPRLQVEHTVTEEVMGVDLVSAQIRIAQGATLADLGLDGMRHPHGYAMQMRINAETLTASGDIRAEVGTITTFEVPTGPGIRIDSSAYRGYRAGAAFDALMAKLIVHTRSERFSDCVRTAGRSLAEFRIEGLKTNLQLLRALVEQPDFVAGDIHTRYVEDNIATLNTSDQTSRYFSDPGTAEIRTGNAGAVHIHGTEALAAPMTGVVQSLSVSVDDTVATGQPVALLEAMKMQHEIRAAAGGKVAALLVSVGDTVAEGEPLLLYFPGEVAGVYDAGAEEPDLDYVRPDLAEVNARRRLMTDTGRPDAVKKRHALGMRTARENIDDLLDPGSFVEYGAFVLAAQRDRRTHDELVRLSPGDGIVMGLGSINGELFAEEQARAAVFSYDWTVFAGTQGHKGHKKTDRLLRIAEQMRLPLVLFTEGGGGRPGDDWGAANLDNVTFWNLARLSGLIPIVGVNNRYCFAGNAAMLGLCDVTIATRSSSIGMGGPAMIEGGGLGKFDPSQIGPAEDQFRNGVIDVLVDDETEAVATAKKYLAFFQGPLPGWTAADQRLLRHVIPENRVRSYDVRRVIELLADEGSVLELRAGFGIGSITALARIEGKPVGLVASNPNHLGGAIDADAADKGARFMQLCDAFDIPIVMLCDTPGFMVGPEVERTAQVRHTARLYATAANLQIPVFAVVLRKGYGLGAQGATGGTFYAPMMIVSWPTGEFGGMGLEGAVRLAYSKELDAEQDPEERNKLYQARLAELYQLGKALTVAEYFELDDVIDPADTRRWLVRGLKSIPPRAPRTGKRRPNIDTW